MTHDEIDKMEAGIKLDALVAEYIMGYGERIRGEINQFVRSYSSMISEAWQVVEKMKVNGAIVFIVDYGEWEVEFKTLNCRAKSRATTAPLAICRAALKATHNDLRKGRTTDVPSPGEPNRRRAIS